MNTITIITAGSRGDVQPYIALGKGLQTYGYTVRLLATEDFGPLVIEAGLAFYTTGPSVEQMMQSAEWRQTVERGNLIAIQLRMRSELKRLAHEITRTLPDHIAGSDLLIGGFGGLMGGFSVAEKFGIPIMQTYVFPTTPTRHYASPVTLPLPFPALSNPLGYHIGRQILWQSMRVSDVTLRRELNMSASPFWGPFGAMDRAGVPLLYGFSPHVVPRPADWPPNHHVTGYWFLDPDDGWQPPADLAAFLAAGPPPVYIGFGSMANRDPAEAAQIMLDALAQSGQRGVIASGWGGLTPSDLPDRVHMLSSIPHSWLFPRMAAVVHHGGAGTTAAGLRAGVPSIIVPFFGDQPFWGRRVAELGVGPVPIPRRKLTASALADAITRAVTDPAMRARAAALGEQIRAEDGIAAAAAHIEAYRAGRISTPAPAVQR